MRFSATAVVLSLAAFAAAQSDYEEVTVWHTVTVNSCPATSTNLFTPTTYVPVPIPTGASNTTTTASILTTAIPTGAPTATPTPVATPGAGSIVSVSGMVLAGLVGAAIAIVA